MTTQLCSEAQVCTSPDQVFSSLGDEIVILNLANGSYYSLDSVGAFVWKLIQEPRRVSAIATAIHEEFEVDTAPCLRDLIELLHQMEAAGLVRVLDSASP